MFYRSTYIVINDKEEAVVVGNWTKLQVSNFGMPNGTHLMTLRYGEFDCINVPCGYFYAAIVAVCLPSFLVGIALCFGGEGCYKCLAPCVLVVPPLIPLVKIGGKVT